jgi:hypothetical protein
MEMQIHEKLFGDDVRVVDAHTTSPLEPCDISRSPPHRKLLPSPVRWHHAGMSRDGEDFNEAGRCIR